MKRCCIVALIMLVPAGLLAAPTMGVYFTYDPYQMHYSPASPGVMFDAYVYAHNTGCYLTAVEFQLAIGSPMIGFSGMEIPEGSLNLGDPLSGVAITYWPPLDGFPPGYNLLATLHLFALDVCEDFGGTMSNVPIMILPHPDTGMITGTCWPDNLPFQYMGLTSTLCPLGVGTEESSWGGIKSIIR